MTQTVVIVAVCLTPDSEPCEVHVNEPCCLLGVVDESQGKRYTCPSVCLHLGIEASVGCSYYNSRPDPV